MNRRGLFGLIAGALAGAKLKAKPALDRIGSGLRVDHSEAYRYMCGEWKHGLERARLRLSAHDIAGFEMEQWYRDVRNGYVPAQRSIPFSKVIKMQPACFDLTNTYRPQPATGPHWRQKTYAGWGTLTFYDDQDKPQTVSGPLFELVAMVQLPR